MAATLRGHHTASAPTLLPPFALLFLASWSQFVSIVYRGKTAEEQRLREGAFGGRQRLASRHAWLSSVLDRAGIAHLPSQAGLFTWLDLRPWLPSDGGGTKTSINFGIVLDVCVFAFS